MSTTGGGKLSDEIIAAENSMRMTCNTVTILSPDDADVSLSSSSPSSPPLSSSSSSISPSPRVALAYNAKEAAAIQQLFGLLAVNQFPYVFSLLFGILKEEKLFNFIILMFDIILTI